jgi:hypothetical protein
MEQKHSIASNLLSLASLPALTAHGHFTNLTELISARFAGALSKSKSARTPPLLLPDDSSTRVKNRCKDNVYTQLTLAALPWKLNPLLFGRPLLVAECATTMKSV